MTTFSIHTLGSQFLKFTGVGALATGFDYAAFLLLYLALGLNSVPAALIGYGSGGAISYLFARRFVFTSTRSHHAAGWRFALVMTAGFCLTGLSMALLVDRFAQPPVIARLVTYGIVLVFNFLGHRFFTFHR